MRRQIMRGAVGIAALAALLSAGPGFGETQDVGRAMEKEYGVVSRETPEGRRLNEQLQRVTGRITSAAGYKLHSATLLGGKDAKHDKVVNAFALPDGRIYVTLGLARTLEKAPDPDAELAFVVGHETTHVIKRHGEKQSQKAANAGIAALLVGVVTGSPGLGSVADAGAAAYVMHFSRRDEYEADKGGLADMAKAGYPLDAAVSMLKRLGTVSGAQQQSSTLNGWFGSHPLTNNRVKHIEAEIEKMRGGNRG
jgi:predicted Zn-dependent protease